MRDKDLYATILGVRTPWSVLDVQLRPAAQEVEEGRLAVFEVATGRKVVDLAGEGLWAADLAWSPDGRWVSGSLDGSGGRVWDADTGELVAMLVPGHTGYAPVMKGLYARSARMHRRAISSL